MSGTVEETSMTYHTGISSPTFEVKSLPFRPKYPGEETDIEKEIAQFEDRNLVEVPQRGTKYVYVRAWESTTLFFYMHIVLFSIVGCAVRIGLDEMFLFLQIENSGTIITHSFISNTIGCFILGIFTGSPLSKTILSTLRIGLSVGFCGSLTTWSNWHQQISLMTVGNHTTPSQPQVLSVVAWIVGFHVFIGSYIIGLDIGKLISRRTSCTVSERGPMIADISAIVLSIVICSCLTVSALIHSPEKVRSLIFSLLLAPIGACVRFWLNKYNDIKFKGKLVPLGTFVSNVSGAILLAGISVIRERIIDLNCTATDYCWPTIVLFALQDGFCGCLTTISTFVKELYELKRTNNQCVAYLYILSTLFFCLLIGGIINGINYNFR